MLEGIKVTRCVGRKMKLSNGHTVKVGLGYINDTDERVWAVSAGLDDGNPDNTISLALSLEAMQALISMTYMVEVEVDTQAEANED